MTTNDYDAIVIGGGPGGYVCAIRLGQLGLRTACVEEEAYGGVCLNWGCIPSKALIATAHQYEKVRGGAMPGLVVDGARVDVGAMQKWKDGIVKKLTGGVGQLLKDNGVERVPGTARLVDARTVEVRAPEAEPRRLRAGKAVVVATGAATIELPDFPFDGERVIGAREAVSLGAVPDRLMVIGGGVIGIELGMVYQALGAQLTVVELTDTLLPGTDPDCVRVVRRRLEKRGGRVLLSSKAEGFERAADGSLRVRVRAESGAEEIACDVVLVAVGMRPRSRDLGLEALGVGIDPRGFIETDARCETRVPGVYAIGDVSGPPMLAHKASKEGEVCAEVIAGEPAAKDWATIPGIIFSDPEVATVGLTAAGAREAGLTVKEGKFPFAALGRAMSIGETDGFVKVVTDVSSGRVVGVHIVGPNASDLISEGALALEMVAQAEDVAHTVHPHPTLGEALMEASAASLGRAIHIVNR
jgi:dihydrolipoamide dehydrogenase